MTTMLYTCRLSSCTMNMGVAAKDNDHFTVIHAQLAMHDPPEKVRNTDSATNHFDTS